MTIEDNVTPELERIQRELKKLSEVQIHIGIQGENGYGAGGEGREGAPADIMTIANVHEFGATIKAKNVKYLAIPIAKKSIGKSPLDFEGLFFLRTAEGYLFGCISKERKGGAPRQTAQPSDKEPDKKKPGKDKTKRKKKNDDIEFLFILMESVNIPERSFIRAGYDNNQRAMEEIAAEAVELIVFANGDAETAANQIGMKVVGMIQEYINQPFNFKQKGKITKATTNWPDNPLIETGRLRNSITYRIEGLE